MHTEILMLAQGQGGANSLLSLIPMFAILAIFWVILIVPQRRQLKEHQKLVAELKNGDEVATTGGLVGTITGIKDDVVQLRTGQSVVVVERNRIARVIRAQGAPSLKAEKNDKTDKK